MEQNVVLEMRDISKNFTGVRALSHVDFTLRKGEIHALMGENGAGKSTLIKVLTGVHEFESGSIHMAGNSNAIVNHSPQEAQANGISTVYQEVNLCPNLTVAENLFIGREPRKFGMIDWKQMNERSGKLLESLDIHVPPTQMLEECSIAIQQMIAIARAVDMKCHVLILDEPTSSLDDDEVEKLFVLMRRLRDEGVGIIFVTHFLEQVYAVCDRITVLRNGELVGEYETKDLPASTKIRNRRIRNLLSKPKEFPIKERLSHLTLQLTKERLSVSPVFLVQDVLNLYVQSMAQTGQRQEPLR